MKKNIITIAFAVILLPSIASSQTLLMGLNTIGLSTYSPSFNSRFTSLNDIIRADKFSAKEELKTINKKDDIFFTGYPLNSCSLETNFIYKKTKTANCSVLNNHEVVEQTYFDVPVTVNKEVERFINHFQHRHKVHFTKWLERSTAYLPFIQKILKEENMPQDLAYIAMIESGFNMKAKSRASAVGPWQFMKWTGKHYGLKVDWWVDERRDLEKSTYAAVRYFKHLYGRFGDWYLSAASYNGGEGRIAGAIRRHKTDDFFTLSRKRKPLKRETKNYVPKFLAAMIISKNQANYGFNNLNHRKPFSYDTVTVFGVTDLDIISRASETSVRDLQKLNPSLKRWFTPPYEEGYAVRLPKGKKDAFYKNIKEIPPSEFVSFKTHKIRKGETLSSIAQKYRTTVSAIKNINNIKNARKIRAGKQLMIPLRDIKRADFKRPDIYKVQKGDTLWQISRRFKLPIESIYKWNNLKISSIIETGKTIILKKPSQKASL